MSVIKAGLIFGFRQENSRGKKLKTQGNKVCIIKNYTNSGADNSASRHDSLNLEGFAELGEENN